MTSESAPTRKRAASAARALTLDSEVTDIRGIGPVRARALARAGCFTVGELLQVLPTRYEDRRKVSRIGDATVPGRYTFQGTLSKVRKTWLRGRGRSMVRGRLTDDSGVLEGTWFNRPYLPTQVDESEILLVHGEVREGRSGLELINPSVESLEKARLAARVVPVYPTLGELAPSLVRQLIGHAMSQLPIGSDLPESTLEDPLPSSVLRRHRLPTIDRALAHLHGFGQSLQTVSDSDVDDLNSRRTPAHGRLIYGEFLELLVEIAGLRGDRSELSKHHKIRFHAETESAVRAILPFELTDAQARVFEELKCDLEASRPMMRLIQGDVGSGKTIVAAMAMVAAVENGLQAVLMAPTEILAAQHHRTLKGLLGERYPVALITASAEDAVRNRRELESGETPIAVGTHALIQQSVEFARLGLSVIDEQHRFGVTQRNILQKKGQHPDLLVMTATPIPRSLALTVYGDLDLSVIDELPPGRTPVTTRVAPREKRAEVLDLLQDELATGAQAFWVCPLIDHSESVQAASIEAVRDELLERFAAFSPAVLHGRVDVEERDRIMSSFAAGEIGLLLATTLVEVGVDVPTATMMVIESAERFGLAQLHQLRGRVGRGPRRSTCIALHGPLTDNGVRRLEIFGATSDGFRIAEADLELRGPGDLLGTRQAGIPFFRVASLVGDREWLDRARKDAEGLVSEPGDDEEVAFVAEIAVRGRRAAFLEHLAGG